MLSELIGPQPRDNTKDFVVRIPEHPWVAHLAAANTDLSWLTKGSGGLTIATGEVILGTPSRKTLLGRLPVGKGQIIYTGWSPAASIPHGRLPATVADERRFEDQMRIITNIAAQLYPKR